ncbi:MAG TPA: ROK family protein, partial [Acidimicrobiales bacterium]|nr:ROK family protein [Acidimicrobiales bacterium]
PGGGPAVGLDIGGTKVLGVALDADGRVAAEVRRPTPEGAEEVLATLEEVVAEVDLLSGLAGAPVGVGAPGLIDRTGTVAFAPNLPGVRSFPLRDRLVAVLGPERRLVVDNDATCAGWGERTHGAAAGASDVLVVTLGTGIGGGVIIGGRLVRGAHGFAGEIGHMVVQPHGAPCGCGRYGCWERYASGSGLGRLAREAAHAGRGGRMVELAGGDPEAVRGEHVAAAAGEGDAESLAVMEQFGWWVALGLVNLANAFDPEVIVLGGGLVGAGDLLLGPTRRAFADSIEGGRLRPEVAILAATLGERAGAIGAADLARLPEAEGGAGA